MNTGSRHPKYWWALLIVGQAVAIVVGGCRKPKTAEPNAPASTELRTVNEPNKATPAVPDQISLFDGATLGQWKIADFENQGKIYVKDGAIHLEKGNYMTGITWAGPLMRMDYEITLEAMRVEGGDFFCGLTFPVGENPCSLILGGWGGQVCGLSNLDHYDAANNETTRVLDFKNGTWYRVRLHVMPDRIQAWLDDDALVNVETTGKRIGIRIEVEPCKPLGISTWDTHGAVRNIQMKKL